jgi:hypothetical protein
MSQSAFAIQLHFEQPRKKNTIVVLGAPRGGTSMVSGICRQLGVPMGDDIDPANNEDRDFQIHGGDRSVLKGDGSDQKRAEIINNLKNLVATRNKMHDVWGWKDPLASYYVEDLLDCLVNNPRYICVFRDPVAVVAGELRTKIISEMTGEEIQKRKPIFIDNVLEQQQAIVNLVRLTRAPTLFLSYEKTLAYPMDTITTIAEFIGRELPKAGEGLEKLVSYIVPERGTGDINVRISEKSAASFHINQSIAADAQDYASEREKEYVTVVSEKRGVREKIGHKDPKDNDVHWIQTVAEISRKMGEKLHSGEFEAVRFLAYDGVAIVSKEFPEVDQTPRSLYCFWGPSAYAWPKALLRIWFQLGMVNLQTDGDPVFAYWCFKLLIDHFQKYPELISGKTPIMYWACLFHLGLSAKIIGRNDEARLVGIRIIRSEDFRLIADRMGRECEPTEFNVFVKRAKEALVFD